MKKPAYYRKLDKLEEDKLKKVLREQVIVEAIRTLARWNRIAKG